ncbi:MAG: hypothetical protein ACSHX9_12280 [Luteolibacter sp.]
MKNKLILILSALSISTQLSFSEEIPYEIKILQNQRDTAISKIDQVYVRNLEKLKVKYMKLEKLDAANMAQRLIEQNSKVPVIEESLLEEPMELIIGVWKGPSGSYTILNKEGEGYFSGGNGDKVEFDAKYNEVNNKYTISANDWSDVLEVVDKNTIKGYSEKLGVYVLTRLK